MSRQDEDIRHSDGHSHLAYSMEGLQCRARLRHPGYCVTRPDSHGFRNSGSAFTQGPLPVNDLGRKVSLTSGSITTAVDRLQARGLVERRNNDDDRRARTVHLTDAGRKDIQAAFRKHAGRWTNWDPC